MAILVTCSLLGISFFLKKNKIVYVIMLIFAFIMTVYATKIPDLELYKSNYLYGGRISEPLYVLGVKLFRSLGLDYMEYRGSLCALSLILLTVAFWEMSPYPNVVLALYLIYPLCYDAVQIRSFVANAFVIFAVRYIYRFWNNKEKSNIVLFVLFILLGTGFHYTAILFLMLGCCFFDMKRNALLFWIIIPIMLIFMMLSFSRLMPYVSFIVSNSNRMARYITGSNAKSFLGLMGLIAPRSCLAVFVILVTHFKKSDQYKSAENRRMIESLLLTGTHEHNSDLIFIRNLLTGVLYILTFTILEITIAEDYERLIRVAIILFDIAMSRMVSKTHQGARYTTNFFMYIYQTVFLLFTLRSMNDFEAVWIPFLTRNQVL